MRNLFSRACSALAIVLALGGTARALDLDAEGFAQRVDASDRTIALARLDMSTANAERQAALSGALPRLSATAGYLRETLDQGQSPIPSFKNSFEVAGTVTQALFDMRVVHAVRASRLLDRLTASQVEAVRQAVVNEARKAFYAALLLREKRAVSRDSEASAGENYRTMQVRYSSGVSSEFELLQAEAAYRAAIPPRLRAERDYELAVNNLKVLAGIDLAESVELTGSLESPAELPDLPAADSSIEARPDLLALEWQRQLLGIGVSAAEAARYPTLNASVRYGVTAASDEFRWENDSDSLGVGVALTVPIFTGGAAESGVRKARVERDKSAVRVAQLRAEIGVDVINTRLRLEEARQSVQAASRSVDSARRAYEIAETRVANRLATQLELSQSRLVYDEARLGYYSAVYDLLAARYDWQMVTGTVPQTGAASRQ